MSMFYDPDAPIKAHHAEVKIISPERVAAYEIAKRCIAEKLAPLAFVDDQRVGGSSRRRGRNSTEYFTIRIKTEPEREAELRSKLRSIMGRRNILMPAKSRITPEKTLAY